MKETAESRKTTYVWNAAEATLSPSCNPIIGWWWIIFALERSKLAVHEKDHLLLDLRSWLVRVSFLEARYVVFLLSAAALHILHLCPPSFAPSPRSRAHRPPADATTSTLPCSPYGCRPSRALSSRPPYSRYVAQLNVLFDIHPLWKEKVFSRVN